MVTPPRHPESRRPHGDPAFDDREREAIAAIRARIDAALGPLEDLPPLQPESSLPNAGKAFWRPAAIVIAIACCAGTGIVSRTTDHLRATPSSVSLATPAPAVAPDAPSLHRPPAPSRARAELDASFAAWLEATNRRDIPGQMAFYPATVPVFYRQRNVARRDVEAEKVKVFGQARVIDIRASEPSIQRDAAARTVVMRFRKDYTIEGPRVNRRGAVVQELRWERTAGGWRIIGERDAVVLARR